MDVGTGQVAFEYAHAVVVFQRAQGVDAQFAAGGKVLHVAVEFARTEQETQFYRLALATGAATGIGGDALGHQFDPDPGRQAAILAVEQAVRAHGEAGVDLFFVAGQDLVDQDHVPGMGQQFGERPIDHGASPIIRLTLLPPKAKELLIRRRSGWGLRRSPGLTQFRGGSAGSAWPSQRCGGRAADGLSALRLNQQNAASSAPAAPRVWPVMGLVEEQGGLVGNSVDTARLSMASLCWVAVPCRFR